MQLVLWSDFNRNQKGRQRSAWKNEKEIVGFIPQKELGDLLLITCFKNRCHKFSNGSVFNGYFVDGKDTKVTSNIGNRFSNREVFLYPIYKNQYYQWQNVSGKMEEEFFSVKNGSFVNVSKEEVGQKLILEYINRVDNYIEERLQNTLVARRKLNNASAVEEQYCNNILKKIIAWANMSANLMSAKIEDVKDMVNEDIGWDICERCYRVDDWDDEIFQVKSQAEYQEISDFHLTACNEGEAQESEVAPEAKPEVVICSDNKEFIEESKQEIKRKTAYQERVADLIQQFSWAKEKNPKLSLTIGEPIVIENDKQLEDYFIADMVVHYRTEPGNYYNTFTPRPIHVGEVESFKGGKRKGCTKAFILNGKYTERYTPGNAWYQKYHASYLANYCFIAGEQTEENKSNIRFFVSQAEYQEIGAKKIEREIKWEYGMNEYRSVQSKLRELRQEGAVVKCKLNSKKSVMLVELERIQKQLASRSNSYITIA